MGGYMTHRPAIAIALAVLVVAAAAQAAPLRPITGYMTDKGTLGVSPTVFFIPDPEIFDASVLFNLGLGRGFDVQAAFGYIFALGEGEDEFHDIWIVPRYELSEGLCLGAGFFVPVEDGHDFGIQPQVHYSGLLNEKLELSVNAGYTRFFTDPATDGSLFLLVAPEVWLSPRFSVYCELGGGYNLDAEDDEFSFDLAPGLSAYIDPDHRHQVCAGVVIPVEPEGGDIAIGAWYYTEFPVFK
jgi:hypothetical protein